MKHLIVILSFLIAQILYGQDKIDSTFVLGLFHKTNYKEANKFWHDNGIVLYQEVDFNDPNIIDDEYSQALSINILATAIKAGQTHFDLIRDSAVIKCTYDKISPRNWSKRNVTFKGNCHITSLTKNRIETEFNLVVTEQGRGIYIYQGKRLFKKSKPLITKIINLE